MTGLPDLTATEALDRMRSGALSPVDHLDALLDRIDDREPTIRAWVHVDRDGARDAARSAERAHTDGSAGPLCGIPFGVKDLILTERLPTAGGFVPLRTYNPGHDATCVARLRAAGAIVLGKVETTQFAGRDPSRTHNPWNLERTASGSSSGSAAAVADRMAPIALGTQTGGSVIRPAAYMGIVGFTPTFGRVSRHGLLPRSHSFDMIGAMGRSVADAALFGAAISGPDPRDRAAASRNAFECPAGPADHPPRLLLLEDFLEISSHDVADGISAAVDRLARAGAEIGRARLPVPLELLLSLHTTILIVEAAATQADNMARHREHYAPGLLAQLDVGSAVPATTYMRAQRLRRRVRHRFEAMIAGVDGFVLPSASEVAPDRSTIGPRLCQTPWTVLGWPCFTVPAGLGADGLPVGLQLVGRPFGETRLIEVADWVERRLDPLPAPAARR